MKTERIAAIKERQGEILAEAVTVIANAKRAVVEQEVFWERNAFLLRARFADEAVADATMRSMWLRRLEKLGVYELVETARYASAKADLPLASALVEEFNSRNTIPRGERAKAFQLLSLIPCAADEAFEIFGRIRLYALEALSLMGGDRTGFGAKKIAVGLQSVKVKQIYDTSVDPEGDTPEAFTMP